MMPVLCFGQYSSYYGAYSNPGKADVEVNAKVNVNQNVKVSGHTTQTINKIDYRALANANAQREKTRLQAQKYADEKSRLQAIEIASNPTKAFEYGKFNTWDYYSTAEKRKIAKSYGFKKFKFYINHPHPSLFTSTGENRWENVSYNEVTTEYFIYPISRIKSEFYDSIKPNQAEINAKMTNAKVGELNVKRDIQLFAHKKEVNRATVYNHKGFKGTLIWEDDYQYTITENYEAFWKNSNGVWFRAFAKVRYYGDKDDITFEDLEGRRHYLHQVIEKVISSARNFDEVLLPSF
jgi:hypothetical protein